MLLDAIQTSGTDGNQTVSPVACKSWRKSPITTGAHVFEVTQQTETLLLQYLKGSGEFDFFFIASYNYVFAVVP